MPETITITQGELDRLLTGHTLAATVYTTITEKEITPKYHELISKKLSSNLENVSISQSEVDALFKNKN